MAKYGVLTLAIVATLCGLVQARYSHVACQVVENKWCTVQRLRITARTDVRGLVFPDDRYEKIRIGQYYDFVNTDSTVVIFSGELFYRMRRVRYLQMNGVRMVGLDMPETVLELDVADNWISRVYIDSEKSYALRKLNMRNNLLTAIGSFKYLNMLEELDLSDNMLHTVNFDVFSFMPYIRVINLARNRLISATAGSGVISLGNLEEANMAENQLTKLDVGVWLFPALRMLNLTGNPIKRLNLSSQQSFPRLKSVLL
ncbi:leucine-rich repeats and immunoglobulin-like domains protein sma-10 [Anopheles ziemanni]|uniref:leucine-rich repeats and immunoglobulin-like domains protein sma-10 n=1 Tax=Anopheles coustani TaxID=139045 RepID=UPI002659628F|nr:leucine-rich repeats and immunoglobulin-like domains protein sma-10 [Anopheles coustani]XP_058174074.1 leucine-rich repeats and immunoglobulin-like domains protein sma-10 [Anopheles ziemanni]